MVISHKLIKGWENCNLKSPPYVFPGDDKLLKPKNISSIYSSFNEYTRSSDFGASYDKKLHLGLLPLPYVGDLTKASIFILMLNPGLSPCDYLERTFQEFRKSLICNLRQENIDDKYPFICLNPQFAWHGGFKYWEKKLHKIIDKLTKKYKINYQKALSKLSQKLACLELLPYHSKSFGVGPLLGDLPSTHAILAFVHEILLPKVKKGEAIIVVTRGYKHWDLPKHKNIIVYQSSESRSAHLTPATRGGKVIAERLGL